MVPKRLRRQAGRYARVDGIPYHLPINSEKSPALMAIFTINADKAKRLMPGNELHPLRLWNKALLLISVIDYRSTDIGRYIEFSIAIACTQGAAPAPRLLPTVFMKWYGTGQFVYDLPVSTEISVKGGKGIWGMPKHQANLDFVISDRHVSSQYDLDGQLAMRIEIKRPKWTRLPISAAGVNYCQFRGMLMKSYIYFKGRLGFSLFKPGSARLIVGNHPRVQALKELEISQNPLVTAFFPETHGILDDHFESWFLSYEQPPQNTPEGLESVIDLSLGEEWLPPPRTLPEEKVTQMKASALGLTFRETMTGGFTLGETNPQAGARKGKIGGTFLSMHATINICNLHRFIASPDHTATMTGHIDFVLFRDNIPAKSGVFKLFLTGQDPKHKWMIYELTFEHNGQNYYLAGKKDVHDGIGINLWRDTTTLYTQLHQGTDKTGPVVGAGILKLSLPQFMRLLPTIHATNTKSFADTVRALLAFVRFFLSELWDSYRKW